MFTNAWPPPVFCSTECRSARRLPAASMSPCHHHCKMHYNTCDQQMPVCLFSHVFIPSSHALFVVYAHMYGSQDDEPIKPTMHLNRRKNGLIMVDYANTDPSPSVDSGLRGALGAGQQAGKLLPP